MPNKPLFASPRRLSSLAAVAFVTLTSTALTPARAAEFASAINLGSLNGA